MMTIRKRTPATDNATTLISEEKKEGSAIESVGVEVGSDAARDDCMTTEMKVEDECEGKAWNGDCVGKIGSGVESVVIWELCVIVERLFVIVVVGITDGL